MPDKTIDSASADAPPRREFRTGRLIAICLLSIAVCLLVLGYHYRLHFYWVFYASREPHRQSVRAVPVYPMPDSLVPDDWVHCRYGPLEFDLPQDLAEKVGVRSFRLYFDDGQRFLKILPLTDASGLIDQFRRETPPPRLGEGLSWLDLQVAAYQTDYRDFRWSMSPDEVAWFSWRIDCNPSLFLGKFVETVQHDDLEGFLAFFHDDVWFGWSTRDGRVKGAIIYGNKPWTNTDYDIIRRVCQSLKITGKIYPVTNPKTDDEARAMFEVVPKGK